MRKCLRAFALTLALGSPTFAGIIHTPPPTDPPPQTAQAPTTDGEMNCPLVQLALSLFALI